MCGIGGILTGPGSPLLGDDCRLANMRDIMKHRGPDDSGSEQIPAAGVGMVHTRLSVIDLSSAGHQPMWNDDHTISIVYNGEVYNFAEIRQELENRGVTFRSRTDTEVILKGYETWGKDVVSKLNGMFAFAIWDDRIRKLWLARDRFGQKPLYYWHDPSSNVFLFASEIKAILEWPIVPRKVDPEGLNCYLALEYVPAPFTMFDGVRKLPSAHSMLVDESGIKIERYWQFTEVGSWKASRNEYKEALRTNVERAVKSHMVSDVPIGAFLSGGVDSSLVVGLMSQLTDHPVKTFSTAFDLEEGADQTAYYNADANMAEIVSREFGTDHNRCVTGLDYQVGDVLTSIVRQIDEPNANHAHLASYRLAEAARELGVTVSLGGDGGDELFGGYQRYLLTRYVGWARRAPGFMRNAALGLVERTGAPANAAPVLRRAGYGSHSPENYLVPLQIFSREDRLQMLTRGALEGLDAPLEKVRSVIAEVPTDNEVEAHMCTDLEMWIPDQNNMRSDKTSMAHSLEIRAPFLDHRLAEVAMSIPFSAKVGLRNEKKLIKEAFADLLPSAVINRPKTGWAFPVKFWLRSEFKEELDRLPDKLIATGLFSPGVKTLLQEGLSGDYRGREKVWLLLVFARWHRIYIGNPTL